MNPNLIDLFERARQGDRHAINELLYALGDRLYRYSYTLLRHRQDAEDAAQQAALELIQCACKSKRIYEFQSEKKFFSFVFTIVIRVSRNISLRRETNLSNEINCPLTDLMDPLSDNESVDRADDIRCLLDNLAQSTLGDQALLSMSHIQGLNSTQIGEHTNTNPATVRSRLVQARKRWKAAVAGQDPQLAARMFPSDDVE